MDEIITMCGSRGCEGCVGECRAAHRENLRRIRLYDALAAVDNAIDVCRRAGEPLDILRLLENERDALLARIEKR